MPIYEYTCRNCGKDSEILVASHATKPACPHCGSRKLDKRLSTFAAHQGAAAPPTCPSGACPSAGGCASGSCPFSA